MRIGILSDVHEATGRLRAAIRGLEALSVEEFICLGDVFESGRDIEATWSLLREVGARCVWGNHELGLAVDPTRRLRTTYAAVINDFADMQPYLVRGDARFSHTSPWCDATDPAAYFEEADPLDGTSFRDRVDGFEERCFFVGHLHRWAAVSSIVDLTTWQGREALDLSGTGPTMVVVHAVVDGWCGLFDTETSLFEPIAIDG